MANNRVSIGSVTNCVFSIGDDAEVIVGDKTYINGRLVSQSEVTATVSPEDDEESS